MDMSGKRHRHLSEEPFVSKIEGSGGSGEATRGSFTSQQNLSINVTKRRKKKFALYLRHLRRL
jgi:hypothetical protein